MSDPSEHLALRLGGFHPTGGQRVSASATLKPRTVVRLLSGGMAHTLAASQRASQRLLAECRALTSSWRLEPFRHLATSLSGELADAIEESVCLANHDSPMVESSVGPLGLFRSWGSPSPLAARTTSPIGRCSRPGG